MKLGTHEGSSIANYLVAVGISVLSVGIAGTVVGSGLVSQPRAIFFAATMSLVWAGAIGSMASAVSVLNIPLSILGHQPMQMRWLPWLFQQLFFANRNHCTC